MESGGEVRGACRRYGYEFCLRDLVALVCRHNVGNLLRDVGVMEDTECSC